MDQQATKKKKDFVDYYELLQISPNAELDTIRKVFRLMAKKYHPDNLQTGNKEYFDLLCQAHRTLTEPELRAAYDAKYQDGRQELWKLAEEANETANATLGAATGEVDQTSRAVDKVLRTRLLSLLYVQMRRDVTNPGVGELEIERLLESTRDHLEFHIWFLKEKGWIKRLDTGKLAITVDGVELVEGGGIQMEGTVGRDRMLEAQSRVAPKRSLSATTPSSPSATRR